jgi:hypothetical protein
MGTDRWAVGRTVLDRVGGNVWVIAQSGAAAGLSWLLAQALVHQPQATFAPFAAIVVLLGGTGGRPRGRCASSSVSSSGSASASSSWV